jgi:cytochrome b561
MAEINPRAMSSSDLSGLDQGRSGMQTDFSLNQPREHETNRRAALRRAARADMAARYPQRPPFDRLTIFLHWATALLVLAMFASAWLHTLAEAQDSVFTAPVLQVHRSLGLTIWVTTGLRIAWRVTNAKLPPFHSNMTKLHRAIIQLSEYVLYALLLIQPATGMGATLFSGRPFALFVWRIPQLVPQDKVLAGTFHLTHELGAWALGALVGCHAAVALIHHFVLRDDVLQCMAPVIATAPRKQEFSLGRVLGEPPCPACIANSASTVLFQGIKPTHVQSC